METKNNKENTLEIRVFDSDGFCFSSHNVLVSIDTYLDRYINDCGSEFIKINGNLYVKVPRVHGQAFERVRSDYQIETAFNPDRYLFDKWMQEK